MAAPKMDKLVSMAPNLGKRVTPNPLPVWKINEHKKSKDTAKLTLQSAISSSKINRRLLGAK
jgi:hypothetical protein